MGVEAEQGRLVLAADRELVSEHGTPTRGIDQHRRFEAESEARRQQLPAGRDRLRLERAVYTQQLGAALEGRAAEAGLEAIPVQVPAGSAGIAQGIEPHGCGVIPAGEGGGALAMAIRQELRPVPQAPQQGGGGPRQRFTERWGGGYGPGRPLAIEQQHAMARTQPQGQCRAGGAGPRHDHIPGLPAPAGWHQDGG
jgi:hypothetical protein